MYRFIGIILLIFISFNVAVAADIAKIKESVWLVNPSKVEIKSNQLKIVLDERQITKKIYMPLIMTVIAYNHDFPKMLNGVDELALLNKYERQGWVFELKNPMDNSRTDLEKIYKSKSKDVEMEILSTTHLWMNK